MIQKIAKLFEGDWPWLILILCAGFLLRICSKSRSREAVQGKIERESGLWAFWPYVWPCNRKRHGLCAWLYDEAVVATSSVFEPIGHNPLEAYLPVNAHDKNAKAYQQPDPNSISQMSCGLEIQRN